MATRWTPQELDIQIAKPLATLRDAIPQAMDLLIALRRGIDRTQVEQQNDLSREGMARALDGLRTRCMQQIDALEAACQQARAQIESTIATVGNEPSDPQRRLVAIAEHEQAWRRLKDSLDKVPDVNILLRAQAEIEAAEQTGDTLRLRVLAAELPAYLQSRGKVMPPAFAERIDSALLSHASPAERRAEQIRREVVAGWGRLVAAFQMARRSASGQSGLPPAVLPGWEPSTSVTPGPAVSMRVTELS